MPTANNMAELRAMIMAELSAAMQEVAETARADMQEATDYFYAGGSPKKYVRTGALGDTPETRGPARTANGFSVEAYLDDRGGYTSGSSPSMGQVLLLADQGIPFTTANGKQARPTVGNKHFWEKAKREMKKSLKNIVKSHFN